MTSLAEASVSPQWDKPQAGFSPVAAKRYRKAATKHFPPFVSCHSSYPNTLPFQMPDVNDDRLSISLESNEESSGRLVGCMVGYRLHQSVN